MTSQADQSSEPSVPQPTTRDQIVTLIQAILGLLGLLGVAVPPLFTSLQVEQQIAGVIMILAAMATAAYHRLVTHPSQVHAAAVASALAGSPRRPV